MIKNQNQIENIINEINLELSNFESNDSEIINNSSITVKN